MWKAISHRTKQQGTTRDHGFAIEQEAALWLAGHGAILVDNNYCCRFGEIDLIMLKGECLLFIEVRFRRADHYGGAAESVTRAKQKKIIAAAGDYLRRHPRFKYHRCRFDVIAATINRGAAATDNTHSDTLAFHWIKQAFTT